MKFYLNSLNIVFKQETVEIPFLDISYFHGPTGAGKTSIALLIDFCFGGKIELTPAMQSEFVSASLNLNINETDVYLFRQRETNRVIATFDFEEATIEVSLPIQDTGEGEQIPNTGIETLSDLLFYLAGINPPKVRKSRKKDESGLKRLTTRNLFWFCYLSQDDMDSKFFHLEGENAWKRNDSLNVLRFLVGFHQEKVAGIESEILQKREEKLAHIAASESIKKSLEKSTYSSKESLKKRVDAIEERVNKISDEISKLRDVQPSDDKHVLDELHYKALYQLDEMLSLTDAKGSISKEIDDELRLKNQLKMHILKLKRGTEARAVVANVEYIFCPRCIKKLPEREDKICKVCGQADKKESSEKFDSAVLELDTKDRIKEIDDNIERRRKQIKNLEQKYQEYSNEKRRIDIEISKQKHNYDSIYLSKALSFEREQSALEQEKADLDQLALLPELLDEHKTHAEKLAGKEAELKEQLKDERLKAEGDLKNVILLKKFYLECLLRSKVTGIFSRDEVILSTNDFLPEIYDPDQGDAIVTSFSNISAGGKKTLFKSCFAIAVHLLSREIDASLPTILIIDSPSKNLSSKENPEMIIAFHEMLYELVEDELSDTQIILIDKEAAKPSGEYEFSFYERYMRPGDDPAHPPLIPYYEGH